MRGGLFGALDLGSPVLQSWGPPPDRFVPKSVDAAWECEDPYIGRRKSSSTPAQKLGLRYQKKIVALLKSIGGELLHTSVRDGVWFCYHDADKRRYCQPDIIVQDTSSKTIFVVEVKLRWTADAWWQLQRLYVPVLKKRFGLDWTFVPLVVTRSYDPAVRVPEAVRLCSGLFSASASSFNVMVVR